MVTHSIHLTAFTKETWSLFLLIKVPERGPSDLCCHERLPRAPCLIAKRERELTGLADQPIGPIQQRWHIMDSRVVEYDAEKTPGSLRWIPSQPNSDHL